MPTGNNNGQFRGLMVHANISIGSDNEAGGTKVKTLPYNFYYAGYVRGGAINNETLSGLWWSRTGFNADYAYYLGVNASLVNPTNTNVARHSGFSLRCITTPTS